MQVNKATSDTTDPTPTTPAPSLDQQVETALLRQRQGDFAFAKSVYDRAISENPRHARALHYSGLLAQQKGRTHDAIDLIRRSLAQDPNDPRAYNHLGQIYYRSGDVDEAETHFRSAVECGPDHPDALNSYANLLSAKGRYLEAISLYRRAAAADPTAAHIAFNLAKTLKKSGAVDDAVEDYKMTLAIQPNHVGARHSLALTLEELGDFKGAVEHYEAVLKVDPNYTRSLSNLLSLQAYAPSAALIERAQDLTASSSLPAIERAKLHHGLGKHFDREQKPHIAFSHFAKSNASQSLLGEAFDANAHRIFVSSLIDTFSATFFQERQGYGVNSDTPVFIVGMPRSGTTLVEQILASHQDVHGAGERLDIPRLCEAHLPQFPKNVATWSNDHAAGCAREYLERARAPVGALRTTDKLPTNFLYLGLIALLFPRAKIIYCRRDPMDIGLSCFIEMFRKEKDFSLNLETIGSYINDQARLMVHWRKVLPMPILVLQYEDVVEDFGGQTRKILDFCGLEWDPACLAFHHTKRSVNTPSRWQVRQPIYTSSVKRWKRYERQLAPLRRVLKGYNDD